MAGKAKSPARSRLAQLLMLPLITHEVEERHREWFTRSLIDQAASFPFVRYALIRSALIGAIALAFLPFQLLLLVIGGGLLTAALHGAFRRLLKRESVSNAKLLLRLRIVLATSALAWAGTTALCIALAPAGMVETPLLIAAFAAMVDALGMVSLPLLGVTLAAVEIAAISFALMWRGGADNYLPAALAPLALLSVHWGLFHLNYQFSTRRLRSRELAEKNETVELLLNHYHEDGSDWLFETDAAGHFVNPSDRFCQAAGLPSWELVNRRLSDLMEESTERQAFLELVQAGTSLRDFVVPVMVAGERRWWSLSARPIEVAGGDEANWRGFVADVTDARAAEDRIAHIAHYDGLTGLPNRNLFTTSLEHALDRRKDNRLVSLVQVELAQFKAINDIHGRAMGDKVLAIAAQRVSGAVPKGTLVARLGGDEFAVLFQDHHDPEFAPRTAKAIVAALRQPVELDAQHFPLSANAGVAQAPKDAESVDDLLRSADLALQSAKRDGQAVAEFQPELHRREQDLRQLELDLRDALGRGQLEVQYQPLLDARSGATVGYEALLRWHHPTRGPVSPAVFVPLAEESGLIIPIGTWVLRQAIATAATWPSHIFISINLSPVQLRDPRLITNIFMAISASQIDPRRIEFEITEGVLIHDSEENLALLHKIRDLGVRIALDDFGTGYSSLNYLRAFPFNKIKIDRCFVTDLPTSKDNQAIVSAVIKLAEDLGMCTLAEGVENREQLRKLREIGCDQLQGFLFSKARPASELVHRGPRGKPLDQGSTVTPIRKPDARPQPQVRPAAGGQRAAN